jgi:cell division GTPase FtsZ
MLIGTEYVKGEGVAGDNELGARIAQESADDIMDEIRQAKLFFESDAIIIAAGAAGGTGSGTLPVITQRLKLRFPEKKVFAMVVLPYEHEERQEERAVYNTAVCLKSVASVADGVFLYDNEAFPGEAYIDGDYSRINRIIADPFYNLLCAGAEKRKKHIGSKLLDAGDILQTIGGWTVVGSGRIDIPLFGGGKQDMGDTSRGIRAMDESIGEISRLCDPADAARALYLITAPSREINLDLVKELGDYLKDYAPNAVIRSGDYPAERGKLEVTVIVSGLSNVPRVRDFYTRSSAPEITDEPAPSQEE